MTRKLCVVAICGLLVSGCAVPGEVSELKSNCFGKLKGTSGSDVLVPVPNS